MGASLELALPGPGGPPRLRRLPTLLCGGLLLAAAIGFGWRGPGEPGPLSVPEPERTLALLAGRTLDLDDALDQAPAWERRLHELTVTEGAGDLGQAIAWYEELAGSSDDPVVEVQLAVLEGEAGRVGRLRDRIEGWEGEGPPLGTFAPVLRAAYLEGPGDVGAPPVPSAELAAALPAGWYQDRFAIRLALRSGDGARLSALRAARAARLGPLLGRARRLAVLELTTLVASAVVLVVGIGRLRRRPAALAVGTAAIPPPWSGRIGVAVLVRGGAAGLGLAAAAGLLLAHLEVDHPLVDALMVPAASLPLILLARRHLVAAGRGLWRGLGLWPPSGGLRRLAAAAALLVAAGTLADLLVGFVGQWAGHAAHWTEWFDRDLAWGTPLEAASSVVGGVVLAPLVEEVAFRGLLYATLRRRLGWPAAALLSAALFALPHGYGLGGSLSVFVSGVVWAWGYERTGSLLPGIAAHAANNLWASFVVLDVFRA